MLTTDPIYKRPLVPVITIKNTGNTSTLYTYSSFTGTATGITTVFPLYCSVSLSRSSHGSFVIQFEDQSKVMEATVTVGSRVIIECGKQSGSVTRLISGLVRTKGYSRGASNKVLYTISGTSTGIRLNELITYAVSSASTLGDGITPNPADATRKADTLLATNLAPLTTDGILSIANLATNSDVETFVASLFIEFGKLQDVVNYIQDISGGEVVVDTSDLVHLRHEIKNTLFGRGFTIKNSYAGAANDDADDTMYLRGKSWNYEDNFYESSEYANSATAVLQAKTRPSQPADLGFTSPTNGIVGGTMTASREVALKFRPTHTRHIVNDLHLVLNHWSLSDPNIFPETIVVRICRDSGGLPQNTNGIIANLRMDQLWSDPLPVGAQPENYLVVSDVFIVNSQLSSLTEYYLDVTKDYWAIISNGGFTADERISVGRNFNATSSTNVAFHTSGFSTATNGGTGWSFSANSVGALGVDRYRSTSMSILDPKAVQAIQSGLTAGQQIQTVLPNASLEINDRYAMYRYLAAQIYAIAKPRTNYSFPRLLAPNIPPLPGDIIIVSDTVLGLSASGQQAAITTCGDMSYTWGQMDTGDYQAPTEISLNCIAVHPRYR